VQTPRTLEPDHFESKTKRKTRKGFSHTARRFEIEVSDDDKIMKRSLTGSGWPTGPGYCRQGIVRVALSASYSVVR
jgi:hypothetical protein